jgi:hypothetical protein
MDAETFAAERDSRLAENDAELAPFVRAALTRHGDDNWADDLVEATSVLWLEVYLAEAPNADPDRSLAAFQTALRESLDETTDPDSPPADAQVDTITRWISTYTANDATWRGVQARGGKFTRWLSMLDGAVRETHAEAHGQIRSVGGTFDIGGYDLHYPGEPVGPPEIWINCRCLVQSAARQGEAMSGTTYTIGPEDAIEDNPDIIPGSDAFAIEVDEADIAVEPADEGELPDDNETSNEVPVHGVLAPEGVATGDGREFAIGALSTRNLPVPLRYEIVGSHGGDGNQVVTVGRVDEAWRNDETNEWEFTGVVITDKPHAEEALAGIRDGSGRGVSIDGDDAEIQQEEFDEDAEIDIMEMLFGPQKTVFSKMRVAGLTIVAIPAFQEAYIAEGHEFASATKVGEEPVDSDTFYSSEGRIAGQTQETAYLTGYVVVVDDKGGPGSAGASVRPAHLRNRTAGGAGAALVRSKRVKLGLADPVLTAQGAIAASHPPLISNLNTLGARPSALHATEATVGAAVLVPPVEVGVRASLTAGAAGDRTLVVDGETGNSHVSDVTRFKEYDAEARERMAKSGEAMDDGSYPIANCEDLRNAIQAIGRASDPDATKRHIRRRKSALGCDEVELPEDWSAVVQASAAARLVEPDYPVYPAEYFAEPTADHAYPLRIDRENRRVHGYVAEWGTCHVGMAGMCQTVPPSATDYAYFKKGVVDTTAGEQFVGNLTWGGHASGRSSMAKATEFYDKPDAVRAFVNVGENAFGVWFAGIIPDDVSDEDITKMRGIGAVSGDWREVRGNLELIGVPVVNTPGLPVRSMAASAGRQTSLIGAGALKPEPVKTATFELTLNADTVAGIARAAVAEYRHQEKMAERVEPARAKVRQRRLAAARAHAERG